MLQIGKNPIKLAERVEFELTGDFLAGQEAI
jgi:hypothetical protein